MGGSRARDRCRCFGRGGLPSGVVDRLSAERLGVGGIGALAPPRRRAAAYSRIGIARRTDIAGIRLGEGYGTDPNGMPRRRFREWGAGQV